MSAATAFRAFDSALTGDPSRLLFSDGSETELQVDRWADPATGEDDWLVDRCTGPTVDLGCGPGRLVAALAARGVPVLGVDESGVAAMHCQRRSVTMLCQDLFAPLPGEGEWSHVLLADGNIGIGGEPARLLERAARLVHPGGTVVIEVDPRPEFIWQGEVCLRTGDDVGSPLPWAIIGVEVLARLGAALGMTTTARHAVVDRAFLELTRS